MRKNDDNRRILALDFAFAIAVLPQRDGNDPVFVGLFPFDSGIDEALRMVGGIQLRNNDRVIRPLKPPHEFIGILRWSFRSCLCGAGFFPADQDSGGNGVGRNALRWSEVRDQRHGARFGRPNDFPLCPCASTAYTAKPALPEFKTLVKLSFAVAWSPRPSFNVGCKGSLEIVWKTRFESGPALSARCTSILP